MTDTQEGEAVSKEVVDQMLPYFWKFARAKTSLEERHIVRQAFATISRQLAEAQAERDSALERLAVTHHEHCKLTVALAEAQGVIERLRALLTDAPILVIDERAATLLGEDVALAYRAAVLEWHPKAKAALSPPREQHPAAKEPRS